MEYRYLISLLAVFVAVLACEVIYARRLEKTNGKTDASKDGFDTNVLTDDDDDDDDDEGSGGSGVEESGSADVYLPSTTASVYFNHYSGVEISSTDVSDKDDVKVEPVTSVVLHPIVLAAIIVGGVLTILLIVLAILFVVYRMRKKDEGSYVLDDPKTMIVGTDHHQHHQTSSSLVYIKAPTNDREFYA